jgi:hypothetical protein
MLGRGRMLEANVMLSPTAKDFPDPYDTTPAAVEKLCQRVCTCDQSFVKSSKE